MLMANFMDKLLAIFNIPAIKPLVVVPRVEPEPILTAQLQRPIPQCGIALLKSVERLELTAYLDQHNIPTIGYGHTLGVHLGMTCTADQAEEWLKEDCAWAWTAILTHITTHLTTNQAGALLSFVFNLGESQFLASGVYQALNGQNYGAVPVCMKQWNEVTEDGHRVVSQGLVNRRLKEINLWTGATRDIA